MIRKIIQIDKEKCNGCGACAEACHEGAIGMVNGKAHLLRDDYCDGLGNCLPTCPTGAITFVEREAAAYDEAAVMEHMHGKVQAAGQNHVCNEKVNLSQIEKNAQVQAGGETLACGCPGSQSRSIERASSCCSGQTAEQLSVQSQPQEMQSRLSQWPVQIKLAPVNAPYFNGAKLLVAADCTAYAYANFHEDFIKGHITLVGCPKLDSVDYSEKLTEIIAHNDIKSVRVVRMEVPCCGGIEYAVKTALQNSGKFIPWSVVTISTDGRILD